MEKFAVFSHGLVDNGETIEFGYHFSNQEKLTFNMDMINCLNSNSFSGGSSAFYACDTGTVGKNSFAQAWANKTKGDVWAFYGQSYYGDINDGACIESKLKHFFGDFYFGGSARLPVAGKDIRSDGTYPEFRLFKP